jgi:hypothetical protein
MKQLVAILMIAFMVPTAAMAKNSACKEEKAKFCKDTKASGGKVRDCLKQHAAEVSAACKAQLDKPKEVKSKEEKAKKRDATKPTGAGDKPAETKPSEPASSGGTETKPSAPASPGGAETKP